MFMSFRTFSLPSISKDQLNKLAEKLVENTKKERMFFLIFFNVQFSEMNFYLFWTWSPMLFVTSIHRWCFCVRKKKVHRERKRFEKNSISKMKLFMLCCFHIHPKEWKIFMIWWCSNIRQSTKEFINSFIALPPFYVVVRAEACDSVWAHKLSVECPMINVTI